MLDRLCRRYVAVIRRIERGEGPVQDLDCERARLHGLIMDEMDAQGIEYEDRWEAEELAWRWGQ